jgi:hypothetical protein
LLGNKSITFQSKKLERKVRLRAGEEKESHENVVRKRRGVRELGLRSVDGSRRGIGVGKRKIK